MSGMGLLSKITLFLNRAGAVDSVKTMRGADMNNSRIREC